MSKATQTRLMKVPKPPDGIPVVVPADPPNKPIEVFRGNFELRQASRLTLHGTLEQHWYPHPQLRFTGTTGSGGSADLERAELHIRSPHCKAAVNVTEIAHGPNQKVSGIAAGIIRMGQNRAVHAVRFHVPNFQCYVADPVAFTIDRRTVYSKGRLDFEANGWRVLLDQDPQWHKRRKTLKARGGFAIGHAGEIRRLAGGTFKVQDVSELWTSLHFFLSFVSGGWTGPILANGIGASKSIWTEWGNWRISDWKQVFSWLPRTEKPPLEDMFANHFDLWNRATWKAPLRELVNWYVEANGNAGALEGSLIMSHTALDMLSWMLLVVERKRFSKRKFDAKPSAERILDALNELKIPVDIPSTAAAARTFAKPAYPTGPEAVTKYRNWLVHPTPSNRKKVDAMTRQQRFELLHLCLQYLELGILALLDYRGSYLDRMQRDITVAEATVRVPWA